MHEIHADMIGKKIDDQVIQLLALKKQIKTTVYDHTLNYSETMIRLEVDAGLMEDVSIAISEQTETIHNIIENYITECCEFQHDLDYKQMCIEHSTQKDRVNLILDRDLVDEKRQEEYDRVHAKQ